MVARGDGKNVARDGPAHAPDWGVKQAQQRGLPPVLRRLPPDVHGAVLGAAGEGAVRQGGGGRPGYVPHPVAVRGGAGPRLLGPRRRGRQRRGGCGTALDALPDAHDVVAGAGGEAVDEGAVLGVRACGAVWRPRHRVAAQRIVLEVYLAPVI